MGTHNKFTLKNIAGGSMKVFEMHYYGTYYYANIIQNVLGDFDFLSSISPFFWDEGKLNFISPFPKKTYLHQFIWFVLDELIDEHFRGFELREIKRLGAFPIETPLNIYRIEHISSQNFFKEKEIELEGLIDDNWEDLKESYQEYLLESPGYWELIEKLTEDVFYILFLNREFLKTFNLTLAESVEGIKEMIDDFDKSDYEGLLTEKFKIKRKRIPQWVKKAVFFRDRGRCVFCNKDLSGLFTLYNSKNYDHIVPLNQYGVNDITNIQLSCESCNKSKSGNLTTSSKLYEKWF